MLQLSCSNILWWGILSLMGPLEKERNVYPGVSLDTHSTGLGPCAMAQSELRFKFSILNDHDRCPMKQRPMCECSVSVSSAAYKNISPHLGLHLLSHLRPLCPRHGCGFAYSQHFTPLFKDSLKDLAQSLLIYQGYHSFQ